MRPSIVTRVVVVSAVLVGAILALAGPGYAQDVIVSGTVSDATGAVLPGAVVTAVHEASGNTFESVTDERGVYRLAVRPGVLRITGQLAGFATVTRSGLELLVGQQAVVNLQMTPSGIEESVTVTGEAPLVDVTSSTLGANVDPRQMQELPLNGRNWQDLTLLARGKPEQRRGRQPADDARKEELSDQRGRPAGDAEHCQRWRRRQPDVQPRRDRGVSVHREPVRRDPGPLERRAGERHHQVGNQHDGRHVLRLFPQRPLQRQRISSGEASFPTRISS